VADFAVPARVYVGVVNDKGWGGVFVSENGGLTWTQKSAGLNGNDVFSLGQAQDGTVLAGTGHGLYRLHGEVWDRVQDVTLAPATHGHPAPGKKLAPPARVQGLRGKTEPFDANISAISRTGDTLYAATSGGLLVSHTAGGSWNLAGGVERHEWNLVAAARSMVVAATRTNAILTINGGRHWAPVTLPESLTQLAAVAVDGAGGLWMAGREGVFVSENGGHTWETLKNLSIRDVNSLFYDEPLQRMLITANNTNTIAFGVHLPDRALRYWNTGWNLKLVRPVGDHLVGATLFDGMVVQPRMVDSAELPGHGVSH
jgi:hypothetical protein